MSEMSKARSFAARFTNGEKAVQKSCTVKIIPADENDEEHFFVQFDDRSAVKVYPDMINLADEGVTNE